MINSSNSWQPLGPEGVRRRMIELQNRMAAAVGSDEPAFSLDSAVVTAFNPFSGPIGSGGTPHPMQETIASVAKEHGIDPGLFDALVQQESGYNPTARSRAGAMGLTQLMPETAKQMGVSNPFDPVQSLQGGARYLSQMIQRYGGDVEKALAAYNAGPGAVDKYGGIPPYAETRKYVSNILRKAEASAAR